MKEALLSTWWDSIQLPVGPKRDGLDLNLLLNDEFRFVVNENHSCDWMGNFAISYFVINVVH